jgi:biotin transport system substrate-specific component
VPLTLQVFVVLLSAGLLGSRLGAASQLEYLAIGACGLPVFSGGKGGLAGLAGPTGGYLVGFVICSFAVGWILDRRVRSLAGTLIACIAGLMLIYLPGWLWLTHWMAAGGTLAARGAAAFSSGILPFVAVDFVKACAAASVIWAVRRRCA